VLSQTQIIQFGTAWGSHLGHQAAEQTGGSGTPWRVLTITLCDQANGLRPPVKVASRRFR
jgi:hypothetical protein